MKAKGILTAVRNAVPVFSAVLFIISCGQSQVQPAAMHFPDGPCDIYEAGGTPCVAVHSTTRVLSSKYTGPLYQIIRESDGETLDIYPTPSGYADAAAQDAFSSGTVSRISIIYDQSGNGNDLKQAAPGTFKGPAKGAFNELPIADMAPATVNGHSVYGAYIMPGMGFRNNDARNIAINDEPEGIYYVIDGSHYDSGCCFDYGNSSTNGKAVGTGTMETTYFGTSTNWGSGLGNGPWIMADMEAGLFSGYGAKQNPVPSIDGWKFVTVYVNGGGGNRWNLKGADATCDTVTTFYDGIRPGSNDNNSYYPMNKKGGILLGNGGDNGNGSAGTFFEGVMTKGFPSDATIAAVQKNISSARYGVSYLSLPRIEQFYPDDSQTVDLVFTNVSGKPITGTKVKVAAPKGWKVKVSNTGTNISIPAGKSAVIATLTINAPARISSGELKVTAQWDGGSAATAARIRCAPAIVINEVGLSGQQFIELYNATPGKADISGWNIEITRSGWAPVCAATIPAGTVIPSGGFYTLSLADSYMAAPASKGDRTINIGRADIKPGDILTIGSEKAVVAGCSEEDMAFEPITIFIPVSTGPWISIDAGSTVIPVTSTAGIETGSKIGIDLGGNYEIAIVKSVGKQATQTTLAAPVKAGQTIIDLEATDQLEPGFELTIGTGARKDVVKAKSVIKSVAAPTGRRFGPGSQPHTPGTVELERPLKYDQMNGVDVSCPGSGVELTSPLQMSHRSGDMIQPLGRGVALAEPLKRSHKTLEPVSTGAVPGADGSLFGYGPSASAGTVALYDKSGKTVIDAVVYGSKQSNSSANGTIATPVIAVMESSQHQGGNIAVVGGRGGFAGRGGAPRQTSISRRADGVDTGNLEADFTTSLPPTPGSSNK